MERFRERIILNECQLEQRLLGKARTHQDQTRGKSDTPFEKYHGDIGQYSTQAELL